MPAVALHSKAAASGGGFNPYVHGARGLFSAMVFVFHVANSGFPTFEYPGSGWVQSYLLSFKFGVELFFGISGFVILNALARSRSLPVFAWERFTRIYPVLWASLTVLFLLGLLVHAHMPSPGQLALNYIVPPPGVIIPLLNPAAWSLSFEIGFYILCAISWQFRAYRLAPPICAAIGVILIAIFPRTLLMLPGILIGLGMLRWRPIIALSRHPLIMIALFLGLWRILEILHGGETGTISLVILPIARWLDYMPAILLAGLLGSAGLLGLVEGRGHSTAVLLSPVMQWMGTVSYSFYLWHPVALEAAKRVLLMAHLLQRGERASQLLIFLTALPLALIAAWISQILIERRFTRWLRQLVEPASQAHTPITASPPIAGAGSISASEQGGQPALMADEASA